MLYTMVCVRVKFLGVFSFILVKLLFFLTIIRLALVGY